VSQKGEAQSAGSTTWQSAQPVCGLWDICQLPYAEALAWQRSCLEERRTNPDLPDVLMLVEHPPVYTLGRGASLGFIPGGLEQLPAEWHWVERGGEVTYHCPGQVVGYPILNLRRHQPDLHWYLRQLEEVIIQTLAGYGVQGDREPGLTGVWVAGSKLAAIGIKVSRWITMHGFALNVCPDLSGFEAIVPCGIGDRPVGSLAQFCPEVTPQQVRQDLAAHFAQIFGVRLQRVSHLGVAIQNIA